MGAAFTYFGGHKMTSKIYKIHWRGVDLEARYAPDRWGVIAHLEIESVDPPRAPLPMTETGYRSHFHPIGTIENDFGGDVVACVIDWLNEEAKSKKWQAYIEDAKQLALF